MQVGGAAKAHREARQAGAREQALRHLLRAAAPHVGNHAAVGWGGGATEQVSSEGMSGRCALCCRSQRLGAQGKPGTRGHEWQGAIIASRPSPVVLVGGEVGLQPLNELVAHLQQALHSTAAVGRVGLPVSLQRNYRALPVFTTCLQLSSSECSPKL